jgi:hypothetical protein
MSERRNTNDKETQYLGQWLDAGCFDSQHEQHLNEQRTHRWYQETQRTQGRQAAEQLLQNNDRCRREFATAIKPTAEGMIALARKGAVTVVASDSMRGFPRSYELDNHPSVLAVFMNEWAEDLHKAPAGSDVFGPGGALGLMAVTIEMGTTHDGTPSTELGVVVRARRVGVGRGGIAGAFLDSDRATTISGHTIVTIQPDGGERHSYNELRVQDTTQFLGYTLGLQDTAIEPRISSGSGGELDDMLGFPGAGDYLAKHLPSLGTYLGSLAEQL